MKTCRFTLVVIFESFWKYKTCLTNIYILEYDQRNYCLTAISQKSLTRAWSCN